MTDEQLQVIMGLILHAGNAKSEAVLALEEAKSGNFDHAKEHMDLGKEALNLAHNTQTSLLTAEASGDNMTVTLLMVHAQDHLMNAISYLGLTQEFIDLYKEIKGK